MRKITILLFAFTIVLIWSCKKDHHEETVDVGYNYFPVDVGHEWIYDVDSFAYDDNTGSTTIDTFYFQYREVISSAFTDDNGKDARMIQRYFRKSDSDVWQSANNWTLNKDNQTLQKVQENIRYVKLLFPLAKEKTWDGNMYNDKGEEDYIVDKDLFDQPYTVNGNTYNKTAKVLQLDNQNFIEEIVRYEIYAREVGMIYFLSDSINTQPSGSGSKSRGYRYRLKLKSYQ